MHREKSILFAEPVEGIALDLQPFVEKKGYQAFFARNLKETLLTLQHEIVDVLVLDAALLEEDCGFVSVIKGMERDLHIIICSDTNTPELETKIRKQRIFYYHIKSFGLQDLEMAVANAVNGVAQ